MSPERYPSLERHSYLPSGDSLNMELSAAQVLYQVHIPTNDSSKIQCRMRIYSPAS